MYQAPPLMMCLQAGYGCVCLGGGSLVRALEFAGLFVHDVSC